FFLREYASFLGLEAEPLVQEFALTIGAAEEKHIHPIPADFVAPERKAPSLAVVGNGRRSPSDPASRLRSVLPDTLTTRHRPMSSGRSSLRFKRALPSIRLPFVGANSQAATVLGAALVIVLVMFALVKVATRGGPAAGELRNQSSGGLLPPPARELPRGGRQIFPTYRVIAYYWPPETSRLGILATGPQQAARS